VNGPHELNYVFLLLAVLAPFLLGMSMPNKGKPSGGDAEENDNG